VIYLAAPGLRIVVLDTRDIDNLKSPHPWFSPDRSLLVAFTPDPDWLLARIRVGPGTPGDIARAIDEAARRPQAELVASPILGANGQSIRLVPADPTEAVTPPPTGALLPDVRALFRQADQIIRNLVGAFPADALDKDKDLKADIGVWITTRNAMRTAGA
jgi:hypothetical protein